MKKINLKKEAEDYVENHAPFWLKAEEEDKESTIEELVKFTTMILKIHFPETRKCYCGNPVDLTNPDCDAYNLCKEHVNDV